MRRVDEEKTVTVPYRCSGVNVPHFFNVDMPQSGNIPDRHGCNFPGHDTSVPIRVTSVRKVLVSGWMKKNLEE